MRAKYIFGTVLALLPVAASAAETINYSYDAKGRLTAVAHSGSVNNGTVANYTYDAADNRTSQNVSGASRRVIFVPLNGLTPIVIS